MNLVRQLPIGWVHVSVADLCQFNPKTNSDPDISCGFVPMAALGTRFREVLKFEIRPWGEVRSSYTHFQNGDVLVAKVTPCFENGKAGIATNLPNGIGAGSSEFCVFRPSELIEAKYLLAWFSTEAFRRHATVSMTGSVGLKRVPKDVFISEKISLPPKAEQKRIIEKLDIVLARVDSVNARLARIAPLLKRFRQSVLAAATSGRLIEDWRSSGSPSPAYERIPLGAISNSRLGKMLDKQKNTGVERPYLGNINVRWFGFDLSDLRSIKIESHEALGLKIFDGDVLVCEGGEPGRCAVWQGGDTDIIFQKAIHRIRPNSLLLNSFWLAYCLRHLADNRELDAYFTGTTIKHLTGISLLKINIPVPDVKEQAEIVRRIEILFDFANRLEARLQSAQASAGRLTPSLLAKAFRGELVPQDPADEPAAELLKRLAEARPASKVAKKRPGRAVTQVSPV